MSAATAAARGRRFAESLMTSTCTVRAPGGEAVTDPDTGAVTHPNGAVRYSGPCRVRPAGRESQVAVAGGGEVFAFDYVVSLPFAEADPLEGDEVTIDSSPDPALVGKVMETQKVDRGDSITARRLYCEDVV